MINHFNLKVAKMEKYLKEFAAEQKELIHILHKTQVEYGYIPPEAITAISKHLNISESEIYGVLTFYKAFSLEPRGEHIVTVCMGTACHVRGGPQIVEGMDRTQLPMWKGLLPVLVLAFALALYLFSWDSQNSTRRGPASLAFLALLPYLVGMIMLG